MIYKCFLFDVCLRHTLVSLIRFYTTGFAVAGNDVTSATVSVRPRHMTPLSIIFLTRHAPSITSHMKHEHYAMAADCSYELPPVFNVSGQIHLH